MDDHPLTPRQKSELLKNPRKNVKSEDKGKQPLNGKPSVDKSSKSLQDRLSKSSPGRQSSTVDGVVSLRSVSTSAKRSTLEMEHDRSKKTQNILGICSFHYG